MWTATHFIVRHRPSCWSRLSSAEIAASISSSDRSWQARPVVVGTTRGQEVSLKPNAGARNKPKPLTSGCFKVRILQNLMTSLVEVHDRRHGRRLEDTRQAGRTFVEGGDG